MKFTKDISHHFLMLNEIKNRIPSHHDFKLDQIVMIVLLGAVGPLSLSVGLQTSISIAAFSSSLAGREKELKHTPSHSI